MPFHHHQIPSTWRQQRQTLTRNADSENDLYFAPRRLSVPHLSNRYAGKGSSAAEDFYSQLRALAEDQQKRQAKDDAVPGGNQAFHTHWSKNFYEPCQDKLIELVPAGARTVLSVGCGWGETERA